MNKPNIIQQTAEHVKQTLEGEGSGHDWWHIHRVWKNAIQIAKFEGIDTFVVELAALLHDIADWKLHSGNEDIGPQKARDFLKTLHVAKEIVDHVCSIVKNLSFKGAAEKSKITTKEGMIVQDADRLDAIGAIGIARTFAYGGFKKQEMHNPTIKPELNQTSEQYKNNKNPTINHFYEKLLLLKNLMNTDSAKRIAQKRHDYMESYLETFFSEWYGKDCSI